MVLHFGIRSRIYYIYLTNNCLSTRYEVSTSHNVVTNSHARSWLAVIVRKKMQISWDDIFRLYQMVHALTIKTLPICILHQDYVRNERILVIEDKDKLTFENAGGFFEGDYEEYIMGQKTPKRYRNPFLAKAMDNVKMVDSKGYGIHNLFVRQKERYLPMPDYEGTDDSHVVMHLPGRILDEKYSIMLLENSNINASSTKSCRDAFLRLGKQDCRIKSPIAKTWQLAETQECVSTVW